MTTRIFLRTHRAKHDQTQAQAAEAIGASRRTFARWEHGDLIPSLPQSVALARWAGCSIAEVARVFGLEETS